MKDYQKNMIFKLNNQFTNSAISIYAGQTAFFLILSLFPFLLFFFSLLNLTPLSETDCINWIMSFVPNTFQDTIRFLAEDIYESSTGRISVTIIIALWLSSKAMVSIQYGLDSVYSIKETRNYFIMRFWGVLYSAILAIILVILLAITVFGKSIRNTLFPNSGLFAQLITLRYLILVPVLFLFIWITYSILPNGMHSFKRQIPGAIFTSIAWVVFSFGFSIYVDHFCNYASIYGTMTTIALIMVWIYGCMYVLFLGGFINFVIGHRKNRSIK